MSDPRSSSEEPASPAIDAFGLSDVGKVRPRNEDHFFVASLRKSLQVQRSSLEHPRALENRNRREAHLFVVADGVGQSLEGGTASEVAVEAFVEHISETTGSYYGADVEEELDFLERLERSVAKIDAKVKEKGGSTTLTLVFLIWPRGYVVHIGDSRGYYLRGGRLKRFTRDQTMGELLVDEGVMSEEEARTASHGKALFSALGTRADAELGLIDFQPGDTLLLCTDGLTRYVDDGELGPLLAGATSAEQATRQLVDLALERGGRDNVTAVVARMG
ncbi:MAG TPA: protein phosphatase 2C domain-containing protein [Thermoanaerobaculia bacterium]|nr:protein phosphatase 2C domain-containing protein [Thermoanaerobaculia bacterium]